MQETSLSRFALKYSDCVFSISARLLPNPRISTFEPIKRNSLLVGWEI